MSILLVEDDVGLARSLGERFHEHGYDVTRPTIRGFASRSRFRKTPRWPPSPICIRQGYC
jgi:DNA-binding response OmpR family regulator